MNDDFLHQHRQKPRASFGAALLQQLNDADETLHPARELPAPKRSRRWLQLVAAVLVAIAVGVVALQSQNHSLAPNLVQIDTRPPLSDLVPITAANVAQLTQVAQVGRGRADSVAYSPDGKTIAVGTTSGIALYDADLQSAPRLLRASHDAYRRPVTYSPDGQRIATIDGAAVRIWDVATGAQSALLNVSPAAALTALQFSPDGRWLAAGGSLDEYPGLALYTWNAKTDVLINHLEVKQTDAVSALAFSPDGNSLAVQTISGTGLYDPALTNRQQIAATTDTAPGTSCSGSTKASGRGVAFSPDGKTLALAQASCFQLIDVATRKISRTVILGDSGVSDLYDLAYSPDGSLLAVDDRTYGPLTWDTKTAKFVILPINIQYWQDISNIAFSPDSRSFVMSSNGSDVVVRDARTNVQVARRVDYDDSAGGITLNADNVTVANYGFDGIILVHNLQTGAQINAIQINDTSVSHLEFTPDGHALAYSGFNTGPYTAVGHLTSLGINLIDWRTGASVARFGQPDDLHPMFTFTPDGRLIAYDELTSHLVWWDSTQPAQEHDLLPDAIDSPQEIHVSADGKTLAEFQYGNSVNVFNLTTGSKTVYPPTQGDATSIALSPDGKTLAVLMDDVPGTTSLATFDLPSGKLLMSHPYKPGQYIGSVAFSPDGKLIAVVGDKVFDVFTPNSAEPLYADQSQDNSTINIAFSSDGHFIVGGGYDGFIRVWGVPSNATPDS